MISRKWLCLRSMLTFAATAGFGFAQAATDAAAPAPSAPAPASAAVPAIRQIIITDGIEAAQQQNALPDRGYVVVQPSVSFLDEKELAKRLAAGEGRPAEERLLAGIAMVVETYAREKDFPIASAVIPPQNIAGGTIQGAKLARVLARAGLLGSLGRSYVNIYWKKNRALGRDAISFGSFIGLCMEHWHFFNIANGPRRGAFGAVLEKNTILFEDQVRAA